MARWLIELKEFALIRDKTATHILDNAEGLRMVSVVGILL